MNYTDSKEVNKVFRGECENRFTLARKAPIMEHGLESLGDIAKDDMSLAMATIKGETELPDDTDKATKMVIEEFIATAKGKKREHKDKPAITADRFMSFWSKVSKHTQSSISSLHYGTYKAVAKDSAISEALATHLTLVARSGVFQKMDRSDANGHVQRNRALHNGQPEIYKHIRSRF